MFTTLIGMMSASSMMAAEPAASGSPPAEPSKDRIICKTKPMLGSRINRTRICKTADEWRIYAQDLEQSRRDINDRGMRGDPDPVCE